MYFLFREKNWRPSDYYFLPEGEKKIVKVFLEQEVHEREQESRKLSKEGIA